MRFQDKVVVVTGAGSGIGKATALAFGREGAKVVAADIDAASAQATAEQIKTAGGQAEALQVDVSVAADVERMVTTTVERTGPARRDGEQRRRLLPGAGGSWCRRSSGTGS